MRVSTEQIISAYKQTASVWRAGEMLGISGQSVWERLRAIDYPVNNSQWTEDEYQFLRDNAGSMTIGQIASKLGRTYNGVALKISRLDIGSRYGNNMKRKVPRTEKYLKANVKRYTDEIDASKVKITSYANSNNLEIEALVHAVQRFYPDWWQSYLDVYAVDVEKECPNCKNKFRPLSKKAVYCSRKCGNEYRVDQSYFGGNRSKTIGLAEKTCQLCARQNVEGISSHHVIGKENDPDNEYLIALCRGCHQIITLLGGRNFITSNETWEALIQLVVLRKYGASKEVKSVWCSVDIELLTEETDW